MVNMQRFLIVQEIMAQLVTDCEILPDRVMMRVNADDSLAFIPVQKTRQITLKGIYENSRPFSLRDLGDLNGRFFYPVFRQQICYQRLYFFSSDGHVVYLRF